MTRAQIIRARLAVVVVATAIGFAWWALRGTAIVCFKTPESRVRRDVRYLQCAIEAYRELRGVAPESLAALVQAAAPDGPFLDCELADLVDPWGHSFVYQRVGGDGYRIGSFGADGAVGGEGDDADILLDERSRRIIGIHDGVTSASTESDGR